MGRTQGRSLRRCVHRGGGTGYASYVVAPDTYPALVLVVRILSFAISLPL
jgi:hypothetical protein